MIPSAIRFHSVNMYPPKKRSFTRYLFILGPNRRGLEKKTVFGVPKHVRPLGQVMSCIPFGAQLQNKVQGDLASVGGKRFGW